MHQNVNASTQTPNINHRTSIPRALPPMFHPYACTIQSILTKTKVIYMHHRRHSATYLSNTYIRYPLNHSPFLPRNVQKKKKRAPTNPTSSSTSIEARDINVPAANSLGRNTARIECIATCSRIGRDREGGAGS